MATGTVYCTSHPDFIINRVGFLGRNITERCPICEENPADATASAVSNGTEMPPSPPSGLSEISDDVSTSEVEVSIPECDLEDVEYMMTTPMEWQETRIAYEQAMQEAASSASNLWKKRSTTKELPIEPLQEALLKAGTERKEAASGELVSLFVEDFLEDTKDSYRVMRIAERNYHWSVEKNKKSKLESIVKMVPDYPSDIRIDPTVALDKIM